VTPNGDRASPRAVHLVDTAKLKSWAGVEPYTRRLPGLKRKGKEYVCRCPYHNDRTPSFTVYESYGEWRFKCFGCGTSGDVIEFVMKEDGVEFAKALDSIAPKCYVDTKRTLKKGTQAAASDSQPTPPGGTKIDFDQKKACSALAENQHALDCLATRGISKKAAIRRDLGAFDYPGIGPCIAIPYPTGDVKFRAIRPKDKGSKFRAAGNPNDKLYGIESIDDFSAQKLLIVESELDQITASEHLDPFDFAVVSVPSATASISGGELRLQPDHLEKVNSFEGKIFIATDQDEAGERWATAALKVLPPERTTRLTWSGAKDVGELFTKDEDKFAETIQQLCDESLIPPLWKKAATFATLPERKFEWVVQDLTPADGITVITGDFGSFKSYLSYFLADAIAGGSRFVDRPCRQAPVLFLDRENSHSTVYLRRSLVGNLKDRDNVRILGLFTDPPAPEVNDPKLLPLCDQLKPVIIIDSLTDFHPGLRESDPDDMTECFRQIRNLVISGAAAVIVLHHVPKNGNGKAGHYGGSTSIPAAGSNALLVEKKGKNTAIIKGFKSRDGEDQVIEIKLHFGPREVGYEVIKAGRDPDEELRDQIEQYVRDNDGCSANDVVSALGKRKATVLAAIEAMVRIGRLLRSGTALHVPAPGVFEAGSRESELVN
jgi:hypothetical protein